MSHRLMSTYPSLRGSRRAQVARRFGVSMVIAAGFTMGVSSITVAAPHDPAQSVAAATTSVVGLREGSSGPGVRAVQERLIGFGYYVAEGASGEFGPGTTAALRIFQRQNGLNPTGVVTENTAKYLGLAEGVAATPATPAAPAADAAAASSTTTAAVGLHRGSTGEAVRRLQTAILTTGLVLRDGVDGTFGASTERAVKLVQRVNGLPETGVVDARTAQVLGITGSASSPTTPAPANSVVQYGARGSAVTRVQQLLIKAGIAVRGGADGIFGSNTRRAVRTFQQANALPVTGVVDTATDAALVRVAGGGSAPAAPPVTSTYIGLRRGSVGPAVRAVQRAILATGMVLRGGADGIFGRGTHNALVVYQRTNGLSATGVVDEATARLMGLLPASTGGGSTPAGGGATADGYARFNERGARVVALQRALMNAGIVVPGGADGLFGSGTAGAVMKFQRAKGLAVTGKVDQATARALGLAAAATPAPAGPVSVRLQARPVAGRCWYVDTWQFPRGNGRVHLGVDIGGAEGTPLRAVVTGRVIQVYHHRAGSLAGNGLKIATADGTYFFYAHLAGFAPGVGLGSTVAVGQVIGYMGHTGNAGMTHLHFEVHPRGGAAVNPFPIVQAMGAC